MEIKKVNEHEMQVNLKAIRVAYALTIIMLVAYCVFSWISTGDMPLVPFLIVCTQAIVFRITKSLLSAKQKRNKSSD